MIKLTYHLDFEFKNRKETDLQALNRVLSGMTLEELELEEASVYLAVTRDGANRLLNRRCGLDCGTLVATPANQGHVYQIDTLVTDAGEDGARIWQAGHPDRVLRGAITYGCNQADLHVLLHHQAEPDAQEGAL